MKFLPKHNVTIYSNYSAEKVKAKLDENISYENNSLFSRGNTGNTYFTGYIVDNVFEVKRHIEYRNSFLPQIRGEVNSLSYGCTIDLTFELKGQVIVFMIMWIAFATIAAVSVTIAYFTSDTTGPDALLVWLMPAFGFGMTYFGFDYERRLAQDYILKLLDATVQN